MNFARRAFKAWKLLPKQPNRKQRFDVFVKNKIIDLVVPDEVSDGLRRFPRERRVLLLS
jgi:hypothetical protein